MLAAVWDSKSPGELMNPTSYRMILPAIPGGAVQHTAATDAGDNHRHENAATHSANDTHSAEILPRLGM